MSFSKKIELETSLDNINEIIEKTFNTLKWRFKRINNHFYEANTSMGLVSWGEVILVNIISSKELLVKSRLKFGLVDWGKNQKNVHIFVESFFKNSKFLSNNKEIKAVDENIMKNDKATFLEKLTKLSKLLNTQILTQDEFQEKKKKLISDFDFTKYELDKDDFLISLINVKADNILTQDDITLIKNKLTDGD